MKKIYVSQTVVLFRKVIWLHVFVSLIFLNYFPNADFFTAPVDSFLALSAKVQQEVPKQNDQKKSVPLCNPNEEKSDSEFRNKEVDVKIYSRNRRSVSEKAKLVFTDLSFVVLSKNPENDPFPHYFPNPSNTCFASLYRFSIF